MRRPRNDQNPCDTSRRWFMHDTKGCKRFGICVHQTADLDVQTGINYFTSYEDCQRACMQGELGRDNHAIIHTHTHTHRARQAWYVYCYNNRVQLLNVYTLID